MSTKPLLVVGAVIGLLFSAAAPALAAGPRVNWTSATQAYFHKVSSPHEVAAVADPAANDGSALRLRLNARPAPNPGGGVEISSNTTYGFGDYRSRLKTANCAGQTRAGVITGFFTYFNDGSDWDGDGIPDNSEIDVEWLCAQPEVVYLTIYTDYAEGNLRKTSRVINLRTGQILSTCFSRYFGDCVGVSAAENQPTSVPAIPNYDSSTEFFEYGFTWSRNAVTFDLVNRDGSRVVLWDYRGPADRIPTRNALYLTNVWHTNNWDPIGFPARDQPTSTVAALLDWTQLPG
jgi:hypothetical protein